jgi:glycerol-3-phosphate dehydrogenase
MAEDCVNQAATLARLPEKPCVTHNLNIHGYHPNSDRFGRLAVYGSDAPEVEKLVGARLHPALPYTEAEVVWAVREEMAETVEDVLARRTRALFLNARAAMECAPRVASVMARELDRPVREIDSFMAVARNYLPA